MREGCIPGPEESVEAFQRRLLAPLSSSYSPEAAARVKELYGMAPDWVEVTAAPLPFWEAACVLIEGERVTLQLHPRFAKRERFWGYTRRELIAHEYVHAMRCAFIEPRFEEILAYQTSEHRLRQIFGPLFRSSWESRLFLWGLLLMMLLNLLFPLFGWTLFLLGGGLVYGLGRLFWAHATFRAVRRKVPKEWLLYLTDAEYRLFGPLAPQEIQEYARIQKSLRWKELLKKSQP